MTHGLNNKEILMNNSIVKWLEDNKPTEFKKVEINHPNKGEVSDGYHSFDELYYNRMVLFAVICNQNKHLAWKSKLHHDGTMYDDYFIVGVKTPEGDFTYHYDLKHWDLFDVKELPRGVEWDGHTALDVDRLLSILNSVPVVNMPLLG